MHLCCSQGLRRICSSTCDICLDPETNCTNPGALCGSQTVVCVGPASYLISSHTQALLVLIALPFYPPEAPQSHVHLHPGGGWTAGTFVDDAQPPQNLGSGFLFPSPAIAYGGLILLRAVRNVSPRAAIVSMLWSCSSDDAIRNLVEVSITAHVSYGVRSSGISWPYPSQQPSIGKDHHM